VKQESIRREPSHDLAAALRRCAAGEEASLRAIYGAEAPRMLGVAIRLLLRRDLAEEASTDLVDDAMGLSDADAPERLAYGNGLPRGEVARRMVSLRLEGLPAPGPNQLFEITLEPATGSPTGRPTGPILMKGTTSNTL
jgi:hypothetical protein